MSIKIEAGKYYKQAITKQKRDVATIDGWLTDNEHTRKHLVGHKSLSGRVACAAGFHSVQLLPKEVRHWFKHNAYCSRCGTDLMHNDYYR